MRSLKKSVFEIGLLSNRYVVLSIVSSAIVTAIIIEYEMFYDLFGFTPIEPVEFLVLVFISSLVLWTVELYKLYLRRFERQVKRVE